MTSEEKPKRRRIMVISGDESIIDEIKKSKNVSLCKSLILETEDDELELPGVETDLPSTQAKKTKNTSFVCVVCGAPALGYNFDAVSCESCKSFFRRNALKDPPLECLRQGLCEIASSSRRNCAACRLQKCLNNGMKRDRLLLAEQKAIRRRKQSETFDINPERNILFPDDLFSPMNPDFLLLSNCFQQTIPQTKQTLLSPEELQRIEYIQHLYQKRIELARVGLPWNPSMHAMTFLQKLNSHAVPLIRLLAFFKQIPEFDQLNVDDKVTLIKFNLLPLLCIDCTLSYKIETDQIIAVDSDMPWDFSVIEEVYGHEGYAQMRQIFELFVRIALYDRKIIQLALITLVLTKGFAAGEGELEPILNDGMAVYRTQNYFIELLWKYIETVHGPEKTIHIWFKLVTHFIRWQTLHKKLRDNVKRNLLSTDSNELLPLMKSLFHI